jgi:hypothetical protein
MNTEKLIKALAADAKRLPVPLRLAWGGLTAASIVTAAAVFLAVAGPRDDLAQAIETWRVSFKFAVTIALAVSASVVALALSRPGDGWRAALPLLAVVPVLLCAGVVGELVSVPRGAWLARAAGQHAHVCFGLITTIGIAPLALLLLALRHGAPTRPAVAGAVAGLAAGGIAATFFALSCVEDSPLFVGIWYSLAVAGLALLGAIGAHRLARW